MQELSQVKGQKREPPGIEMKLDVLKKYDERLIQKLEGKNLALEA